MLPDLTYAQMSPDALAYYRSAFPTVVSRRAVRQWPLELPLDGIPVHNAAVVEAYRQWLTRTEVPKLLFYGNAGVAIKEAEVVWCREHLSN
jgi:haloalkane dehalogenase